MKSLIIASSIFLMSSSSFAAYICKINGTGGLIAGLADREGGGTEIYIKGRGYYEITSSSGSVFYSISDKSRVMIDFEKKILKVNSDEYKLSSCRSAGE